MKGKGVVAVAFVAAIAGGLVESQLTDGILVEEPRVTLHLAQDSLGNNQAQTLSYSMDVDGDGQFEMEWLGDPVYRFDGPTLGTFRVMERDAADSMTWYVRAQGPIVYDIYNAADSAAVGHVRPPDLTDFGLFGQFYSEGSVLEYEDGVTVWRWPGRGHWYFVPIEPLHSVHFRYIDDGTQFLIYRMLNAETLR